MKRVAYLVMLLSAFAFSTSLAGAQIAPRAAPPNNNYIAAADVYLSLTPNEPTVFTVPDMDEADTQLGELLHTCAPDNAFGSVWYDLSTVPGTLVIDTAGSNIDTIMTLYHKPALANISYLDAVACADTGTGGSAQARMSIDVPAGYYVLQVTHNDPVKPPDAEITISFSLKPDSKTKVANDTIAKAKPLKMGKRFSINTVEYAATETAEPTPTCAWTSLRHTVWYTFDMPFAGDFSANMFGTALEGPVSTLSLGLYREDTPGTLTEIACDEAGEGVASSPVLDSVVITPGTYYVQVGVLSSLNLLPGSRYMLHAGVDLSPTVLHSGDFEGDNAKWKIGGAAGSAIETEPPGSALTDTVFACRGGKSTLKQKLNFGGLRFKSELRFGLSINIAASTMDHYAVTGQVTVKYANGTTAKATRTISVMVGSLTIAVLNIPIKPGQMTGATFTLVCAPPAGQTLYFDTLALRLEATTPYRAAPDVLPLPPAPAP